MKKLYIIDGYSLLFRAFYGTSFKGMDSILRTSTGIPTNAIYAFGNMLIKLLNSINNDDGLFVGLDSHGPTFRKQKYDLYKANRSKQPEELDAQKPILREFLTALNIKHYEVQGYEGDDICGSVAKLASAQGIKVFIYTSDRDYLQLIDDNISINILKKGMSDIILINKDNIVENFGFTPTQLIDFKSLRGDVSDNLPGAAGIGEKTAIDLINKFGSMENVIKNVDQIKGKCHDKIINSIESIRLTYDLAKIVTDMSLPFTIDDLIYPGYEFESVNKFALKYELKTLLSKLPSNLKISTNTTVNPEILIVNDLPSTNYKDVSIYINLDKENYHFANIKTITVYSNNVVYLIQNENIKNANNLRNVLENNSIEKYTYDYKACKISLLKCGVNLSNVPFDLLICSYLLDSSFKNDVGTILNYFNIDLDYSNENNFISKVTSSIYQLKDYVINQLKEKQMYDLYVNIERPLIDVLIDMELEGFPVDKNDLNKLGEVYKEKLKLISNDIYSLAGQEFNISSPKQVIELLNSKYPELKIKSTSSDILESYESTYPIISKIIEYRKYAKLINSYIESIIEFVKDDNKIHAIFNQALTATGRLSSKEPNLQNISVRDEEGRLIRKAFHYPDNEFQILSLDYSQIELRVLAAISKSKTLIDIFNQDKDIHEETARKIFNITGEVDPIYRRRAKTINFGIIYGMSDFGLAKELNISYADAKKIIDSFFNNFPDVFDYLRSIVYFANKNGYVTTYFNRRRYIRDLNDSNYSVREFAKRAATNAPIQGSAADLIKIAMIKISKLLKEKNYKSKLILQVHDELVFKIYDDEKDQLINDLVYEMEHIEFPIKLKVSIGLGNNYYEVK